MVSLELVNESSKAKQFTSSRDTASLAGNGFSVLHKETFTELQGHGLQFVS